MRILMIHKFLYPKGGSETYLFQVGAQLHSQGHQVQYFGMDSENRCLGNRVGAYTSSMDFHRKNPLTMLSYAFRTIYSREARRKLRQVLEDFQPEVCHLNNFHYQLTPSILLEIRKWSRQSGYPCKLLYTAHDYQLVCPNHMCRNLRTGENCEKCLDGKFSPCVKNRCIHGSFLKSGIGTLEAIFWNKMGVYRQLDKIICCSHFLKSKLDRNPILAGKTTVMHNFAEKEEASPEKKNYVLFFGRYSQEKGVLTLLQAARELPQIPFVFAGAGPLAERIRSIPNVQDVGFQNGEALKRWIREAKFTVCPSETYENCPFSVLESISLGTPVLGAEIGGIPELIRDGVDGRLFESGNERALRETILSLWEDPQRLKCWSENCKTAALPTVETYVHWLLGEYAGGACGT